jgi:hypothetical protein
MSEDELRRFIAAQSAHLCWVPLSLTPAFGGWGYIRSELNFI